MADRIVDRVNSAVIGGSRKVEDDAPSVPAMAMTAVGDRPRRVSRRRNRSRGPGHPAPDRSQRDAEMNGRLFLREALPVAEHHGVAILFWQSTELLLHDRTEFLGIQPGRIVGLEPLDHPQGRAPLDRPSPSGFDPGTGRDTIGDPIKPTPDRLLMADGSDATDEDQERRLERVLGVVRVMKPVATDAQDHRTVAEDEDLESRLGRRVATAGEPLQQLTVGQPGGRPDVEKRLDFAQERGRSSRGHPGLPSSRSRSLQRMPGAEPSYP